MDLLTFIDDSARRKALAAATASSPDYLWQIATKRRTASPKLARLIDEKSREIGPEPVTKESLRPDIWEPQPKRKRAA